ncbi:MAG TPA: AarF/ABC1/UbiB kinase family protein [Polyangiaceae bacterium]|nr:AarF/ABC1/UbiB kinase family protein [Polyangiaceae bacterium]
MVAKFETDLWRRSKSMLGVAAGVVGHELKHQVVSRMSASDKLGIAELKTRIEQAKVLAEGFGRLKGAFMKAGQMLSIDASDLLPPEALEILSKLQGQADPIDFAIMREVLERELGNEKLSRISELDETAVASASIGQVYRARAFGEPVAIKVQYPGISESIDADVDLLEKLGSSWLALSRRKIDASGTFEELRTMLKLEADYERERYYLERFGQLLQADPRFDVPRSVPELCTARVLTMSWASGTSLNDWIRSAPVQEERLILARTALDLYCLEFFTWGVVQTDPNFGNFLVRTAERQLVLLDFGASVEYDDQFRTRYIELLRAVARGNRHRISEHGIGFELMDERESSATKELFVDMLLSAAEPFDRGSQPFNFRDADYAARSSDIVRRFVTSLRFSPPPRRLIFLHRKLGGLFQLLKRLDVALDLAPYWDQMLAGFEPRTHSPAGPAFGNRQG